MSYPALRFSGIVKNYGRATVLHKVSFEVAPGEFFGLVGVNGAGKTTLLKCLLDFCSADSGTIDIFGTSNRLSSARQRLSFLPERFQPPYYLTGAEFIRYVLQLQNRAMDVAAISQMLEKLDLDPGALERPVRAYSKGMTQKLGLAACFLSGKDLYVLDEPTSGLDPKARALFKARLQQLKQEVRTVFFTSHALADVAEICDRMAVIDDGRVRFVGTPRALCQQFAHDSLEQAFLHCIENSSDTL